MLETFLAFIGTLFAPSIVDGMEMPGGMIGALILPKLAVLGVIVGITVVTNIIRALRYCRSKEGKFKSLGIKYGIYKGLICGGIATVALTIISYIPVLRIPFTIISFIPYVGTMIDGFILGIFYLISYMLFAYPIYGSC